MLIDLIIGAASGAILTAIPYQFVLSAARKEIDELEREVNDQAAIVVSTNSRMEKLILHGGKLQQENEDLQTKLAQAVKNDARDPKTGRFMKAAPLSSAVQARSYENLTSFSDQLSSISKNWTYK